MEFTAKITREINRGNLVAVADVVADNALLLKGVKLLKGENGMFLGMPSTEWKDRFGETHYEPVFQPADRDVKADMFRAVRDAYTDYEETLSRTQTETGADPRAGPRQEDPDELPFEPDEGMTFGS